MKRKVLFCTSFLLIASMFGCGQQKEDTISTAETESTSAITQTEKVTTAKTSETTKATEKTTQTTKATTSKKESATETAKTTIEPEVQEVETPVEDAPPIEVETVPVPNDPVYEEPIVEEVPPVPEAPAYDQGIYEKLGVEVQLSGTNEQQAQQYYDAVSAAYPSLPWSNNGSNVSVDLSALRSEASLDVWSMTDEEVDAAINERLAGRDYHDIPVEELAQIIADIEPVTDLGQTIGGYFRDLTSRDFNAGGYSAL